MKKLKRSDFDSDLDYEDYIKSVKKQKKNKRDSRNIKRSYEG